MNDEVYGTDWAGADVAICLDSYLVHLRLQIEGRPFNKAALYRDLSEKIGRTPKSIERKFQNISAVLDEIGFDWIAGLAPLANYQLLLADVVLSRRREIENLASLAPPSDFQDMAAIYIEPPPERETVKGFVPDFMERLVRHFDPVERDLKNRALGAAGEELVFEYEKHFLKGIDRDDLAQQVRWISKEEGDGAGYDILSYSDRGEKKFIEVKTTIGGNKTPFFMSRNEFAFAREVPESYRLMRVFEFRRSPRAFELQGPLEKYVRFSPETYRADFRA